ncbi:MAG: GNAT family N-acetyltransferase [Acidimicrobiia bacterium]|nr:GNAT family N-acetyltransferase [Acidimicrobiia bacterium]
MKILPFDDHYDLAAPLYGVDPGALRADDTSNSRLVGRWLATEEGVAVAAVTAWVRPDERMFLSFAGDDVDRRGMLGAAAAEGLGRPVYVSIDAADTGTVASLAQAGFTTEVESDVFGVPFETALGWLRPRSVPAGFRLLTADLADRDRLFELDNRLRASVPGTDGWQGDRTWFDAELSDSPPFDPAGYLVAVHESSGDYAGLIRFWRNRSGPRLGLIGVLPAFRRTTIAAALLRAGLEAASTWGFGTFTTETSTSNHAIHPRLVRLAGPPTARFLQLVLVPRTGS